MNLQKVLLGALLIKPELAPYALPNLEIEHFPADLQPECESECIAITRDRVEEWT